MTSPSPWLTSPAKRALDLAVAVPLLLATAPLQVLLALAVRIRLGRPARFRQVRAGRAGATIVVTKLRTMTDERGPDGRPLPDGQRLTGFGRRLRATSLDELPQLWSVVTGAMSLVGPRPLPTTYLDRYSPEQRRRLEAKPGVTGWAQVNGRNSLEWADRLALDVWYVDHASALVDLKILLRTLTTLWHRQGVAADGHATMPEFRGET